jgi:hypothetical protein
MVKDESTLTAPYGDNDRAPSVQPERPASLVGFVPINLVQQAVIQNRMNLSTLLLRWEGSKQKWLLTISGNVNGQ